MDRRKNVGGLLLAGALAAPLPAAAVDDMFLSLEGVKGESVDGRNLGAIEILTYSQSFTGPGSRVTAADITSTGKTTCGPVTITKYVDQASPDLILLVTNGRRLPRAVITFRRPGQQPIEYYKVTLEDVVVTEVEQSNSRLNFPSPAPPRAIEKVSLIASKFRFDYVAQHPDGRPGAQPKAGWDCVANLKR